MTRAALAFVLILSRAANWFAASSAAGGPIPEMSSSLQQPKNAAPAQKKTEKKRARQRTRAVRKRIKRKPLPKPSKREPAKAEPDKKEKTPPRSVRRKISISRALDSLLAFGVSASKTDGALTILHVRRGSPASDLGLKPRDTLLTLNGRRTKTLHAAAQALRSWKPETRLSAVVHRGDDKDTSAIGRADLRGKLARLESPARHWPRPVERDALTLKPPETLRAEQHVAAARESLKAPLKSLSAPSFRVASGERIWIRFPNGIAQTVQTGDVLEGETSTAMAADKSLDFLVIPQGSRVWAQVVSSRVQDSARIIRLVVYKIGLDGGKVYPCSAAIRAISGTDEDVQIAPGGSIVSAPDDEAPLLVSGNRNFQIEFRQDLVILEPLAFYRSGPGLWLRSLPGSSDRHFEISHVIAGRSAHAAGLKVGDRVTHINGRPVYRLGFSEAIRQLYGTPGSNVEIKVLRASSKASERVRLKRGAGYRMGYGLELSAGKDGAYVIRADNDSPAYNAGIRRGYRVDSIDGQELAGLGKEKLLELLKPHEEPRTIVFKPRDKHVRDETIRALSYPYARSIRKRLKDIR